MVSVGSEQTKRSKPLTSSVNDDFGTPSEFIEVARETMGGIDLDPASSSYWNHWLVKATTYYDERINGLNPDVPWFGRMWVNAPSSKDKGISVTPFWRRLVEGYASGVIDCAFWCGFNLSQLTQLQASPMHPLQFLTWFPAGRVSFMERPQGGGPPIEAGSPMHGNFFTFLPTRKSPTVAREQVARFVSLTSQLSIGGAIVRPV